MPFCQNCGAEIGDHIVYCPQCGAEVSAEKVIKGAQQKSAIDMPPRTYVNESLPELVQRNYLLWLVLSIVTGIFSFIYLYFIIEDLNKLDNYPRPKNVPSTKIDTTQVIIWLVVGYVTGILLPFAMVYIYSQTFGKLYDYINSHPMKQTKNTVSGRYITAFFIIEFTFILLMTAGIIVAAILGPLYGNYALFIGVIIASVLMTLIVCGMGIYMYILQYRWQEAFNERVRIINPNARMVDLF
ncbi:MAG: zinc-ribbon domain-containing protein [Candidatus Heimdallarchaeota archaeon]|nr:zinc-ribbon domain-containing protein [Candidatus Heimdallarchaeota archaeon]